MTFSVQEYRANSSAPKIAISMGSAAIANSTAAVPCTSL
jgi:hypothetical protein